MWPEGSGGAPRAWLIPTGVLGPGGHPVSDLLGARLPRGGVPRTHPQEGSDFASFCPLTHVVCHTPFISRNHCNKLLQSVWLKTAAMYSLRVLEAEVPSPGEGRAAVPPTPQGKALPASSRFRWPRCLNRAREDAFPREGRFGGPGGRVEDSPGGHTHARGARPRGAEPAGRPHAEHVLSPAPPGEAALPFHAPFTGGKAETSVSLGRGLQATRWPAQGWT